MLKEAFDPDSHVEPSGYNMSVGITQCFPSSFWGMSCPLIVGHGSVSNSGNKPDITYSTKAELMRAFNNMYEFVEAVQNWTPGSPLMLQHVGMDIKHRSVHIVPEQLSAFGI